MSRPKKPWSHSEGERPYTVRVYERKPGGMLYARIWDSSKRNGEGNWSSKSLGHKDKERAITYAKKEHLKLLEGASDLQQGKVTLSQVFALYHRFRTPRKSKGEQIEDSRRIQMWTRFLGAGRDPHQVRLEEWERFISQRKVGAIDPYGRQVGGKARRPVSTRTVEKECLWLRWVFNWASKWRTPQGNYLMRENPVRGYEIPTEKNPKRPVATQDRFEAIRSVADQITMEIRWNGKRETQRSYLSEVLDIVNGTGRRISAVCQLRYEDLRLSEGPYGSIRWPADTDKSGRETVVPINPQVRAAVDRILRERPGIGSAPVFPKPTNPEEPVTYYLVSKWLRKAEDLAGVETQDGSLWHAYRRKWGTERKYLPDVDVAAAGGWKNTVSLKTAYQQADTETILRVVLEPGELREAR